jgi:hypothetical protein
MLKNKTFWTIVGFLLAGTGLIALILSLVGVQLVGLAWLGKISGLLAFVVHLLMVMGGFVLVYLMRTNFSGDDV